MWDIYEARWWAWSRGSLVSFFLFLKNTFFQKCRHINLPLIVHFQRNSIRLSLDDFNGNQVVAPIPASLSSAGYLTVIDLAGDFLLSSIPSLETYSSAPSLPVSAVYNLLDIGFGVNTAAVKVFLLEKIRNTFISK